MRLSVLTAPAEHPGVLTPPSSQHEQGWLLAAPLLPAPAVLCMATILCLPRASCMLPVAPPRCQRDGFPSLSGEFISTEASQGWLRGCFCAPLLPCLRSPLLAHALSRFQPRRQDGEP